jgi:hypothetical protein
MMDEYLCVPTSHHHHHVARLVVHRTSCCWTSCVCAHTYSGYLTAREKENRIAKGSTPPTPFQ